MKYRILYQLAEPLRSRTPEGAQEELARRSDDLDEYALQANLTEARLQASSDGKNWETITTIKQ